MKKIITVILLFVFTTNYAQSPQGINYQSIIRNSAGAVLPSTSVLIEFKLYGGLTGPLIYFENHNITTNSFGMANVIIGQGIATSGSFNAINWANGIAYEVYVNSNLVGTKQLFMSVPYALFSPPQPLNLTGTVLSSGPPSNSVTLNSGTTYTNGSGISILSGTIITNTAPNQTVTLVPGNSNVSVSSAYPSFTVSSTSTLSLSGTSLSISNGNTVILPNPGVSTTLTPASFPNNNVLIAGTLSSYTIGSPSYSITNPSGNTLLINNGINSSTTSIPSPTLNLTSGVLSVGTNSINLSNPTNGFWSVKGNLGTVSATNFIGTTDAVDLNIRTNNISRMTVTSTGNVGLGITTPTNIFTVGNVGIEKFNIFSANGSMNFLDDQASITFPATGIASKSMIQMFASGTANPSRMVISHSAAFPTFGLQYEDGSDRFNFIGNGNPVLTADLNNLRVGIGTTSPTAKLDVAGNIKITDGTQGVYKILTSDAVGNASWTPAPGVEFGAIISTSVNLSSNTDLASILLTVPGPGFVVVTFDGFVANNQVLNDIILAVSNTSVTWGVNNGHTRAHNVGTIAANQSFSHTQTYTISSAGTYTYYAVAVRWSGSGTTNIYGNITARFFPNKY